MSNQTISSLDAGLQRMIRAHLWYGAAGLILGLITAMVAINFGPEYLRASPLFTIVALGLVGTIGLSMAGGLSTFWSVPEAGAD